VAEKYGDLVNIREFKASDLVLHSKIMMIDQRLVTISSVNLNNRSFFHDSENGIVVLDPAFYHGLQQIYAAYVAHSQTVATHGPAKRAVAGVEIEVGQLALSDQRRAVRRHRPQAAPEGRRLEVAAARKQVADGMLERAAARFMQAQIEA